MIHVAEDVNSRWPVKDWYRKKNFIINDGVNKIEKTFLERHPKWGTLHFAERTLCKDLASSNLLKTVVVDGILLEAVKAQDLIVFLNRKNNNGYPYFCL